MENCRPWKWQWVIMPSFYYFKVFWQTFWLSRPKILDCPWAPLYSLPLHPPLTTCTVLWWSRRRYCILWEEVTGGGGGSLSPWGFPPFWNRFFIPLKSQFTVQAASGVGLLHLYMHISACLRILCVFFHRKAANKIGRETGSEGRFCRQWKVPNRPWFLAESAVKACGDLATLVLGYIDLVPCVNNHKI